MMRQRDAFEDLEIDVCITQPRVRLEMTTSRGVNFAYLRPLYARITEETSHYLPYVIKKTGASNGVRDVHLSSLGSRPVYKRDTASAFNGRT